MMFTKSRLMTVGITLLALAVINRVGAAAPVRKLING